MDTAIGIDMGGTSIKLGLVHDGTLVEATKVPAAAEVTLSARLDDIALRVRQLADKHGVVLNGIGLAFPGIVDAPNKRILSRYVKYPDADTVDLPLWAAREFGLPIAVENDARAHLVGEWQYGAGRGCDDLVLVTLGTGVGSAAMMDGNLIRGRHHIAGNLGGHMTVNLFGSVCNCGNIGCVESEASTWSLQRSLSRAPEFHGSALSLEGDVNYEKVFRHAANGDALALKIKEHALRVWSLGILNLILAYDPMRVVIGGGVMRSGQAIIPQVQKAIACDTWIENDAPEVVAAEQAEHAGILGMAWLALNKR